MTMPDESAGVAKPDYRSWLLGPMVLIAIVIVVRFVLECVRVPKDITRYVSGSVVSGFVLIYLGAVAPLRGITRYKQLLVAGLVLSVWAGLLDTLALVIAFAFHLPGSHFADAPGIFQNWGHVGMHTLSHVAIILPSTLIDFGIISLMFFLWRWPVVVPPSAVIGGLVILRFTAEAFNLAPTSASAWSSSVAVLLGALYIGGVGPRTGLVTARQLLAPSLALGWVWRLWVFIATLVSALPLYKTHFFDPTQGQIGTRLLQFFLGDVLIVGGIAGLLVWGIAVWTAHVTRQPRTA
jgi:hypothetical protein